MLGVLCHGKEREEEDIGEEKRGGEEKMDDRVWLRVEKNIRRITP